MNEICTLPSVTTSHNIKMMSMTPKWLLKIIFQSFTIYFNVSLTLRWFVVLLGFLTDLTDREIINPLPVLNSCKGGKPCLSFSAISCVPIKIFSVFTSPWNIHLWSGYSSLSCAMIIGIRDPYHARYNSRTEHKLWRFVLQHVSRVTSTRIITDVTDVDWTLIGITMHVRLALRRACDLTCWHFCWYTFT